MTEEKNSNNSFNKLLLALLSLALLIALIWYGKGN